MAKKATKKRTRKKVIGFPERAEAVLEAENKLYEKYEIKKTLIINFPRRRKIPFLSKVALSIINRQGGIIDARLIDTKRRK